MTTLSSFSASSLINKYIIRPSPLPIKPDSNEQKPERSPREDPVTQTDGSGGSEVVSPCLCSVERDKTQSLSEKNKAGSEQEGGRHFGSRGSHLVSEKQEVLERGGVFSLLSLAATENTLFCSVLSNKNSNTTGFFFFFIFLSRSPGQKGRRSMCFSRTAAGEAEGGAGV